MDHVNDNYKHSSMTDAIICSFYTVYNTLGYGFLEKVYKNALLIELQRRNFFAEGEKLINVYYLNNIVGEYYADILVDNKIILEVKATRGFAIEHEAQLLNYLRATEIEVGLLLNFGPKPEVRRKVFENCLKGFCL